MPVTDGWHVMEFLAAWVAYRTWSSMVRVLWEPSGRFHQRFFAYIPNLRYTAEARERRQRPSSREVTSW
jgi:hypothetical protein